MNEIYGPAQVAIDKGVPQLFDYGVGMTVLALGLMFSISINIWLLKYLLKTGKDTVQVLTTLTERLNDY